MTYKDVVNIIRNAANYVNPNGTFIHGRKSDGSLQYNDDTPQIILLEPQPNPSNNNQSYVETVTFPIIFVTQDSPESSNLEREDIKEEMFVLSRQLLSKIDEQSLLQNVAYTNGQPEIRQLSGTMTGFSYSLQITYPLSECTLDYDLPPEITLFATETNVVAGTEIQIGWIANNVNSVTITPFGVLQGQFGFIDVTVNSTTTFNGSATNSAGTATDSITITVGAACLDATAVLKDTANNTISTTNIASGDSEDIIAPDGNIILKKSDNSNLRTVSVRSNQSKNETISDSVAVIKDTANNTLKTENILAETSENITINNTLVQLKDSAGNNIGSQDSYLAESSNNKTAPDGTVNIVNTDNDPIQTETVRSGQTKSAIIPNVSWTNTDGSPESTPYGDSIVCDAAPILNVDFSVNDTTPDTNQTVTFTDLTVGATQWLWDFGDGTTSSLQNPTKTYRYAGSYTVTLCATNGSISGKDIKSNYIVVTLQALISTNLQQYLACGIGASPSNMTLVSGLISQWNDESGNGYHETQGTATNRPTYNSSLLSNAIGTFGGGVFDGNDFLRNTNVAFTRVTGSFQIIFFRKKRLTVTEVYSEAGTTSTYEVFSSLNNSNLNLFNGTTSTNSIGYTLNDFMILQAHFNGASSYVQINELSRYTIPNNIGTTSGVGTTSGAQFSGSSGALMDMLEKVTYSSKPSDANIFNIVNRFKSKFGLW